MKINEERLKRIFDSTAGRCHLCKASLRFDAYGRGGEWEIDHSRARKMGGTDHLNNLRPACVSCNRSRQARAAREVRVENGLSRPPVSAKKRRANTVKGGVVGGVGAVLLGATGLGPILFCAGLGAAAAASD